MLASVSAHIDHVKRQVIGDGPLDVQIPFVDVPLNQVRVYCLQERTRRCFPRFHLVIRGKAACTRKPGHDLSVRSLHGKRVVPTGKTESVAFGSKTVASQ